MKGKDCIDVAIIKHNNHTIQINESLIITAINVKITNKRTYVGLELSERRYESKHLQSAFIQLRWYKLSDEVNIEGEKVNNY